jgi:hypothetical protein
VLSLRNAYIGLMLIAGIALGLAVSMRPELGAGSIPPIMILLLVSLIIDVTIMAIAAKQGAMPLTTNSRVIGFFGAAALYLAITYIKTAV